MNDEPRATVRMIEGTPVLFDPDAIAMMTAVGKHNCRQTLLHQADRVRHFVNRIAEKGLSPADVIIVLLNVDDVGGGIVAEALMPGRSAEWAEYRERGQIPYARGLAMRQGIQEMLAKMDKDAANKLREIKAAVLVMDYGVCEVFDAEEVKP